MIPGMPRASHPDFWRLDALTGEMHPVNRIRITKLDADGVPAGDSVTVTGRIKINEPQFLQDEKQREEDHAWQVRRDKKRKELAEMYGAVPAKWLDDAADQQTPRIEPVPPQMSPTVQAILDQAQRWYAPVGTMYHQYDSPDLQTTNHPCTLVYDTENGQQEEGPHSMYSTEAIQQAAYTLQQEREAREAAEIIDRIKAFGDDVYADDTILRFTRQFYRNTAKTQLHDPAVFSALRYTDECGNTIWSTDEGTKRTWDALVTWFVTHGKPITLDDVEIFPPAVFPAESGTVVKTEITGIVQ